MESFGLNEDLDELELLREIVGGARVVALGESSHHVREFYQVRHRMMRFLAERCGFSVYMLEAPFTQGHLFDSWTQGGPGTVEDVAAAGIAANLGDCAELHEALEWIRERNATDVQLRCVGADLPGSAGSPLPVLAAIEPYLRKVDPGALPMLAEAAEPARRFDNPSMIKSMSGYAVLDAAQRDALTIALSRLLARMERSASFHRGNGQGDRHEEALHHLRGAWMLDQLHRSNLTDGFESASTFRDAYIARSVQRILDTSPSGTRIVLAAHNWHIKKTLDVQENAAPLLTAGYHLAEALGDDYRAIAITHHGGRTAIVGPNPDDPEDIAFIDAPLPEPAADSIEAAFPTEVPWTLADLRAAASEVDDAKSFKTTRMSDYFLDDPAFEAFDAVALVSRTSTTGFALPGPDGEGSPGPG